MMNTASDIKIAVIGLGYVGLPLALGFAEKFSGVVGYDISEEKISDIQAGKDPTGEGLETRITESTLRVTTDPSELSSCNFFVVGVPTPVDEHRKPDLSCLESACETVGAQISKGSIVVFESTVYPGVTEEVCVPLLEKASGLHYPEDFTVGYSPERINPGDKEHTLESITKVVSGSHEETLHIIAQVYGTIVTAGVYCAPSIRVAEAAKVIENTQRDLNIALMNELALIFDRIGIRTKDVLDTAATKWNFLRFTPGLVGGHCIGVDPYYLTTKAQKIGYHPEVILAGRRINDNMGIFIANRLIKILAKSGKAICGSRVGVLGITFKENVSDLRNSRVPDIVQELKRVKVEVLVHDPRVSAGDARSEYGVELVEKEAFTDLDAVILAVPHKEFQSLSPENFEEMLSQDGGVFIDIKSVFNPSEFSETITYWSL